MPKSRSIDEYIAAFPDNVQAVLVRLRATIKRVIPEAEEVISYSIPCYKLGGNYVIYFAGWKQHVSIYPIPAGSVAFVQAIAPYVAGRGTLKFPLNKPIPYKLIERVVKTKLKTLL